MEPKCPSDAKVIQLPKRSAQYWLETLSDTPPIHILQRSNEPTKYVYRCTWTNLPIENAFAIPGWCLTGNKSGSVSLHGRFMDLGCLYSWVQTHEEELGRHTVERITEWLWGESGMNHELMVDTPSPKLLRANGGHLTVADWRNLYYNSALHKKAERPHIFAEAEKKLRDANPRKTSKPQRPMDPIDITNFDQTLNQTLSNIAASQQQLNALGETQDKPTNSILPDSGTKNSKSSAESAQKRTLDKMNVDAKKSAPKKPKSTSAAVPDFKTFIETSSSAVGNGVAPAAAAPKKKRAPAATGNSGAAPKPKADEDPQQAMFRLLYESMMKEKKAAAEKPASASASSSSAVSTAPSQKRNITVRKGNKKTEQESKDFYHDLAKLMLSDEGYNTSGIIKVALVVLDNKGVLHVTPLLGSNEATVNLA